MKKKSCIDCQNLRYQSGEVWCRKGHIVPIKDKLPIKKLDIFKEIAQVCEEYDDADL